MYTQVNLALNKCFKKNRGLVIDMVSVASWSLSQWYIGDGSGGILPTYYWMLISGMVNIHYVNDAYVLNQFSKNEIRGVH